MSSAFRRTLPARPDLDQQKKLAKELLRAFRGGDPEAAARMRAELPDKAELSLTDAQCVLAREYGFTSWRELREHIEQHAVAQLPPLERFKHAVEAGDARSLREVLERHADVRAKIDAPIFSFDSQGLVGGPVPSAALQARCGSGASARGGRRARCVRRGESRPAGPARRHARRG